MSEGHFLASLPVFVVVDVATFQARGLPSCLTTGATPEHGKVLPLFTDKHLAKRFIADLTASGKAPLELKTLKAIRAIAEDAEKVGVTHVVVDIDVANRRGRSYPVREF